MTTHGQNLRAVHDWAQIATLREVGATGVFPIEFDADRTERHAAFLDEVADRFGRIGVAVCFVPILARGNVLIDALLSKHAPRTFLTTMSSYIYFRGTLPF